MIIKSSLYVGMQVLLKPAGGKTAAMGRIDSTGTKLQHTPPRLVNSLDILVEQGAVLCAGVYTASA